MFILVRKGEEKLGLLPFEKDVREESYWVEIRSERGVLFDERWTEDSLFFVDVQQHQQLTILFKDEYQRVIHEQKEDLTTWHHAKGSKKDRVRYEEMVKAVKEEMDAPKGTELEIEWHTQMLNECTINEQARAYVMERIRQVLLRFSISEEEIERYTKQIYADFYGMGVLQEIDDDPEVGEIMVNGFVYPHFHCDIYYVKHGQKIRYDKTFQSLDELLNVFSRAIAFSKKELNSVENAIIEATRSNRDRVNIIIPDAAESYVMNIRKFQNFVPDLANMKKSGTVDDFIDRLMRVLVKGKANIGIGGAMGTGKTTFINFLLSYTPPEERKVVIASVSEMDVERVLKGHDVVVLNVDDSKQFTFERLIRASLRTTADRIIIPESRGGEFRQVYEANLKTKGNMFTAHALDDYSFLDICVDMYTGGDSKVDVENIRNKIAKSIDIVVIMRKVGDKIRIKSISEVVLDEKKNFERMNLLYYWHGDPEDPAKGEYRRGDGRLTEGLKRRLNEYGVPMSEMRDL